MEGGPFRPGFWTAMDRLVAGSGVVIDRPAGSAYPRYPQRLYSLDYGYLKGTTSADGAGIDLWRGKAGKTRMARWEAERVARW